MISDFVQGVRYFIQGFSLINQPGMRRFVVVPFLVNTLIFSVLLYFGLDWFNEIVLALIPAGDSWWITVLKAALWVVAGLAALAILFFGFSLIANLIASPFNDLLAEKVEEKLCGTVASGGGIIQAFRSIGPAVIAELKKYAYFLLLLIIVGVLTVVLNVLAAVLWPLFTAWMLALEYLAYPMNNHSMTFGQIRARIRKKRWMAFGFGVAVLFATTVPLVNFIVMPVAVAGATVFWCRELKGAPGQ